MAAITKQQADAYDRIIDAAAALSDLLEQSGIELDEYALEELTIFLANHAVALKPILKNLKYKWP